MSMPLYICRWQNGDFSAVSASSRSEAIELLDEVGNAEVCELFAVKNFMVHFRLKEEVDELDDFVPVEFESFGEGTEDMLCDRVYPVHKKAMMESDDDWPDDEEVPQEKVDAVVKKLNEALSAERTRQWGSKEPQISDDPEAAHLQKVGHNVPKAVAERVVKERRHRTLLEMPPGSDKVH
jgi:hypothetical protein